MPDTIDNPPAKRTIRGVNRLPADGWGDYGSNPPPDPGDDDSILDGGGPTPPRPEQMRGEHPLMRLWRLMQQIDPYLDDRRNDGSYQPGISGTPDYMPPEQTMPGRTRIGDQYQEGLRSAVRYLPSLPVNEIRQALTSWMQFKQLVRGVMIQVGRMADEATDPPQNHPDPPLNFAGWKAVILQLRHCDQAFRRIQQFVNQHQELEELFANPFQQFMGQHQPVLQAVTTGLQGLVSGVPGWGQG